MINYSADQNRQYHTQLMPGEVGEYVLLPGDPKRCEKIANYLDSPVQVADSREYVTFTGTLEGRKVSVTSTGIGGPSTAIAMEELWRCGAKTFIRVGSCGGMALDVKGGDIVVATGAIRMEGTTVEYAPIEFPAVPDFDVTLALAQAARKLGIPCHRGVVQCKDSFFGQHEPENKPVSHTLLAKWDAWLRLGTLASEMESAALFVVGSALHVRTGTVLQVLGNQERAKAGLDNPICRDTDPAIRTAVEAVRILMGYEEKGRTE